MRVHTVIVALFALLTLPAAPAHAEAPRARVLMHVMPWYTTPDVRGAWGPHWTGWQNQHDPETLDDAGLPDIWSNYHPLVGLYDSADPHVIECHLLQMKLAGVDGVIADWYGIHDVYDYAQIHEATTVLFEQTARLGMTFALCYEDRTTEPIVQQTALPDARTVMAETFAWLDGGWFAAAHYERLNGRPLLLNFGPIAATDPADWAAARAGLTNNPALFALHHLWRGIGADGGFTWVHQNCWDDLDPLTIETCLRGTHEFTSPDPAGVIPSALPGFDDVYDDDAAHLRTLPHRDGATLRESLRVALDGPWPIVQLATWNDYGEGTMLEPTHEFGYLFLEIIQAERRREDAAAMPFTPADLRLPARLLNHRRLERATTADLNRIAGLLAAGQTKRARALLDRLDARPTQRVGPQTGPRVIP